MEEKVKIVGEKYRCLQKTGSGGTAVVWKGERISDGRKCAIKVIPDRKNITDKEVAGRKKRWKVTEKSQEELPLEVHMMKHFYHPAFPRIWEAWQEGDEMVIVMDYVEGICLEELLKTKGAVAQEQAVEWGIQLCHALMYLHCFAPPVIYRDMKPANLILQENGRLKLVDFGTARQYHPWKSGDTIPLGTPGYAAPELYRGRQSSICTDVYSLGVTLYYFLTGHNPGEPPFQMAGIRQWNRELSPALERIVRKCTMADPIRRYHNCGKVLKALERWRECQGKNGWRKWNIFLQNLHF